MLTLIIARTTNGKAIDFGNPRAYAEQVKRATNIQVATALSTTFELDGQKLIAATLGDQTARAEEAYQRFSTRADSQSVLDTFNVVAVVSAPAPVKVEELSQFLCVGDQPLTAQDFADALTNVVPTAHLVALNPSDLLQGGTISIKKKDVPVTTTNVTALAALVREAAQHVASDLAGAVEPSTYLQDLDGVSKLLNVAARLGILTHDQVVELEDNIDAVLSQLAGADTDAAVSDDGGEFVVEDGDDDGDDDFVTSSMFLVSTDLEMRFADESEQQAALTYALSTLLTNPDYETVLEDCYDHDDLIVDGTGLDDLKSMLSDVILAVGEDDSAALLEAVETAVRDYANTGAQAEYDSDGDADEELDDGLGDIEEDDEEGSEFDLSEPSSSTPVLRSLSVIPHFVLNLVAAGPIIAKDDVRKLLSVVGSDGVEYNVANPLAQASKKSAVGILRQPLSALVDTLCALKHTKLLVTSEFEGDSVLEALEHATGVNLSDSASGMYVVGNDEGDIVLDFDEAEPFTFNLDSLSELNYNIKENDGEFHVYACLNFKVPVSLYFSGGQEKLGHRLETLTAGFASRGLDAYAAVTFNAADAMLTTGYGPVADAAIKGMFNKAQEGSDEAVLTLVNTDYSAHTLVGNAEGDWAQVGDTPVQDDNAAVAIAFASDTFSMGGTTTVLLAHTVDQQLSNLDDDDDMYE